MRQRHDDAATHPHIRGVTVNDINGGVVSAINSAIYINDRVAKCQCHIYIYHHDGWSIDVRNWRLYTRNYSLIDNAMVFPNNIKGILKNTEYKPEYAGKLNFYLSAVDDLVKTEGDNPTFPIQ